MLSTFFTNNITNTKPAIHSATQAIFILASTYFTCAHRRPRKIRTNNKINGPKSGLTVPFLLWWLEKG